MMSVNKPNSNPSKIRKTKNMMVVGGEKYAHSEKSNII